MNLNKIQQMKVSIFIRQIITSVKLHIINSKNKGMVSTRTTMQPSMLHTRLQDLEPGQVFIALKKRAGNRHKCFCNLRYTSGQENGMHIAINPIFFLKNSHYQFHMQMHKFLVWPNRKALENYYAEFSPTGVPTMGSAGYSILTVHSGDAMN